MCVQLEASSVLATYELLYTALPTSLAFREEYAWLVQQLERKIEVCMTSTACFRIFTHPRIAPQLLCLYPAHRQLAPMATGSVCHAYRALGTRL